MCEGRKYNSRSTAVLQTNTLAKNQFDMESTKSSEIKASPAAVANQELFDVVKLGNVDKLLKLLEREDIDIEFVDKDKCTALHWAAFSGKSSVLHILLKAGANPNLNNSYGNTPLHIGSFWGFSGVVTALLAFKADPAAVDKTDNTPLHLACKMGRSGCAALLIAAGAPLNGATKLTKLTPVHFAVTADSRECLALLIEAGADLHLRAAPHVNARLPGYENTYSSQEPGEEEQLGPTAYKIAHAIGNHEMMEQLQAAFTAKSIQIQAERCEAWRLKREEEKRLKSGRVSVPSIDDSATPRYIEIVEAWDKGLEDMPRAEGSMFALVKAGQHEEVATMLQGGEAASQCDEDCNSLLHIAAKFGHVKCIEVLLKAGANPCQQDMEGSTALHWAAGRGDLESVKALSEGLREWKARQAQQPATVASSPPQLVRASFRQDLHESERTDDGMMQWEA